jgi:CelD/BcsL family acetyltransferase involved in cellulose biosynthesis
VIPKGFLKRVEQTRRAADRHFRVELSVASTVAAGEYLERLFKLHTARWSERRQTGVFADSATRRFYLDAVPRLVARDQAWLLELMFDGTPVASLLALHGHERVHYYVGGFDSRYATFSPGRLLIAALFERAVAQGYEEVDFLRGVERYKYDWGALNRSTCCITIEPLERRACATG